MTRYYSNRRYGSTYGSVRPEPPTAAEIERRRIDVLYPDDGSDDLFDAIRDGEVDPRYGRRSYR